MKCPYCGAAMETGRLTTESGPGLFFLPDREEYRSLLTKKAIEKKGGIVLEGPYLTRFHRVYVPCSVCKACRKLVIEY